MLLNQVRRTIRRYGLAGPTTRVVAALSGGPDSMALVHLLRELDAAGDLRFIGAVHFNHQLRGAAVTDEAFCARLTAGWGLPFLADRGDVAALAARERRSLEDAARTARHEFFERARDHFSADVIALGHTRDDQAETYLLRLVRGAGVRGLSAMHPRRGFLIRPLIECRRSDLRSMLDAAGVPYVHDETNDDVTIPRNRVRAELLPFLEDRFNPAIVDVLADQAEVAREEWHWMEEQVDRLLARAARHEPAGIHLDADMLGEAPRALARLAIRRAMTGNSGGRPVSFAHVERVLEMLPDGSPLEMDAPGQRVQRIGREIVLTEREGRGLEGGVAPGFSYPLAVPGEVFVPESGCSVTAEELPAAAAGVLARGSRVAIVRSDLCRQLAIRSRRPGDRFRPLGLGGAKKLQDFFVDRKVARRERDTVPLVVDENDRIVWVAGHTIDDQFRVTDPAQAVIILRLKVLGGSE